MSVARSGLILCIFQSHCRHLCYTKKYQINGCEGRERRQGEGWRERGKDTEGGGGKWVVLKSGRGWGKEGSGIVVKGGGGV